MVGDVLAKRGFGIADDLAARCTVAAPAHEGGVACAPAKEAGDGGRKNDDRERNAKEEDRHERCRRDPAHDVVLQRARADAHDGLKHDCEHGGLQAEEQRLNKGDVAEQRIDPAQRHDRDQAGEHEQRASDKPALGLVEQPADVDGELLRLGAGQQHAIVERVKEPLLADPSPLLDQHAVHHRDLAGRAAEA